jgi:hypothetical protein
MARPYVPDELKQGNFRIANGTLQSPAIRFGAERSGIYRVSAGRWAVGINQFRSFEITANDVAVRSNSPGAGRVTPLAVIRANATTADNQETAIETFEVISPTARAAVYRQTSTKYGWKLYGSTAGTINANPDMTLNADGVLFARVRMEAPTGTFVAVNSEFATFTGAMQGVTGAFSGAVSMAGLTATTGAFSSAVSAVESLSVVGTGVGNTVVLRARATLANKNAMLSLDTNSGAQSLAMVVYGGALGGLGSTLGDSSIYTTGNFRLLIGTNNLVRYVISGDGKHSIGASEGAAMWNILTTTAAAGGGMRFYPAGNFGYWYEWYSDASFRLVLAARTMNTMWIEPETGYITFGQAPIGSARIFIRQDAGSANDGLRWRLSASEAGAYIDGGGNFNLIANSANMFVTANLAIFLSAPNGFLPAADNGLALGSNSNRWVRGNFTQLQVGTGAASQDVLSIHGGGIFMGPAAGPSPLQIMLSNHPVAASQTAHAMIGFSSAVGHYLSYGAYDLNIYTGGAAAGRLVFGTVGARRLTIGTAGKVTIGASEGSSLFNLIQPSSGFVNGMKFYNGAAEAHIYMNSGDLILQTGLTAVGLSNGGNIFYPVTPNVTELGTPGNWFFRLALNGGIGVGLAAHPSAYIHLGLDSAQKPSTNTWQVVSDSRTKVSETIRDYTEGLNKIVALRPVLYRYNGLANTPLPDEQDEDSIGFLAEEAQAAAPEMVKSVRMPLHPLPPIKPAAPGERPRSPGEDRDPGPEDDILTVNTHALTFMMVNAFKEIKTRLEALESGRPTPPRP